jgi:hypothetical protein
VIRNVALHIGTPSKRLNAAITRALALGIRGLGVDPNDPATTWPNSPFRLNEYSLNEFFAGNPLHLLLILGVAGWTIGRWRSSPPPLRYFLLGVICAYVFFCAYIPWNWWAARLQLTPFVLGCPIVGCVLVRDWKPLVAPLLALATLMAVPDALMNVNRPLVGRAGHASILQASREDLYFMGQAQREGPYLAAIAEIRSRDCHVIGVDTSQDVEQFEYPFFAEFSSLRGDDNIRDTGVTNGSARFVSAADRMTPCAVICLACTNHPQKIQQYIGQLPAVKQFHQLLLFEQEPALNIAR